MDVQAECWMDVGQRRGVGESQRQAEKAEEVENIPLLYFTMARQHQSRSFIPLIISVDFLSSHQANMQTCILNHMGFSVARQVWTSFLIGLDLFGGKDGLSG